MTAGGIGAVVGTPAEVALIRMTSDGRLPEAERRNYKNGIDALFRIAREEGVGTLWKGCAPTVGRAMILNAAQLSSYAGDSSKTIFVYYEKVIFFEIFSDSNQTDFHAKVRHERRPSLPLLFSNVLRFNLYHRVNAGWYREDQDSKHETRC